MLANYVTLLYPNIYPIIPTVLHVLFHYPHITTYNPNIAPVYTLLIPIVSIFFSITTPHGVRDLLRSPQLKPSHVCSAAKVAPSQRIKMQAL